MRMWQNGYAYACRAYFMGVQFSPSALNKMEVKIVITPAAKKILKKLQPDETKRAVEILHKGIKWKFARPLYLNESEIKAAEATLRKNLEEVKSKYGMKYRGILIVSYHPKHGALLVKVL